jgi:hypothetical protein
MTASTGEVLRSLVDGLRWLGRQSTAAKIGFDNPDWQCYASAGMKTIVENFRLSPKSA